MKAIVGRLRRLENHWTPSGLAPREYFQIVVSHLDCKRSLRSATYSSQLWSDGKVMEMIRLGRDRDATVDATDEELEQWIEKQRAAEPM
jgi:hypothetical protein